MASDFKEVDADLKEDVGGSGKGLGWRGEDAGPLLLIMSWIHEDKLLKTWILTGGMF